LEREINIEKMADKIDGFLVEKVSRHNMDGNVVIEISVSTVKGEFDEEFSEWDSFERQDYLSENFFKDGKELSRDDWFGGMDEEYEEADWETEAIFKTLEEARECENELTEEI
jgi:hypothetical protein